MKNQHKKIKTFSTKDMAGFISSVHEKGCPIKFRVNGISMFPFIKDGDVITVVALDHEKVATGDIIARLEKHISELLVHRIIRRRGDMLDVKGDNLKSPDAPVSVLSILGKISAIERNGRPVRFSLGPEKKIIAILSRTGLLRSLTDFLRIFKSRLG